MRNNYLMIIILIIIFFTLIGCSVAAPSESSNNNDNNDNNDSNTVTYDGNGHTNGTVPVDTNTYKSGDTVIVASNTGNLINIDGKTTAYYFTGWNTEANGSGTGYLSNAILTMGDSNVILYAQWESYKVKDEGPAGGWIFYDKGSYSNGWRYLEAAPASTEFKRIAWGKQGTTIGGTQSGIGKGKENTIIIVSKLSEAPAESNRAAQVCDNLDYNGYSDWFLPSIDELNLMQSVLYKNNIGGFIDTSNGYWSSTEGSNSLAAEYAGFRYFDDAGRVWLTKVCGDRVRAARRF